jgi:hypothetical protein
MSTSQFDKALQLINELNESSGDRESYKMQILSQGKYQNAEISNLIDQIKSILKRNRITFRWFICIRKIIKPIKYWNGTKIETTIPTSEWAQVSLFKDYLENNEEKSHKCNEYGFDTKIDTKIKHRILNEFWFI